MAGHGICSKVGCDCQYYVKSLLTPGLCKSCAHVKALHNKFIHHNEDDLDENLKSTALLKGISMKKKKTVFDYLPQESDAYDGFRFKQKKVVNHTETMWKNKWKESQKEVEKWQAKYNDLYLKYKELLKEKEEWTKQSNSSKKQISSPNSDIHMDFLSGGDTHLDNSKNDFSEWQTF